MKRPDDFGAAPGMVGTVAGRPPVVLCLSDYDTLERTALAALLHTPRVAASLLEEVDRAAVVADAELRSDVVRLGSWVAFRNAAHGALRRVRLVATSADAHADDLSVLTPEGAALIGLRRGQTIGWSDRIGAQGALTVISVGPSADDL
jgi:regulator of nucleoside diphosphate kinase